MKNCALSSSPLLMSPVNINLLTFFTKALGREHFQNYGSSCSNLRGSITDLHASNILPSTFSFLCIAIVFKLRRKLDLQIRSSLFCITWFMDLTIVSFIIYIVHVNDINIKYLFPMLYSLSISNRLQRFVVEVLRNFRGLNSMKLWWIRVLQVSGALGPWSE